MCWNRDCQTRWCFAHSPPGEVVGCVGRLVRSEKRVSDPFHHLPPATHRPHRCTCTYVLLLVSSCFSPVLSHFSVIDLSLFWECMAYTRFQGCRHHHLWVCDESPFPCFWNPCHDRIKLILVYFLATELHINAVGVPRSARRFEVRIGNL